MSTSDNVTRKLLDIFIKMFVRIINKLPIQETTNEQTEDMEKFLGVKSANFIEVTVQSDPLSMMFILKVLHDGFTNIVADKKRTFRIKSIKSYDYDDDSNICVSTRKDFSDVLIGPDQYRQMETGDLFFITDGNVKIVYGNGGSNSNYYITAADNDSAEAFTKSIKHKLKYGNIFKDQLLRIENGTNIQFVSSSSIQETSWDDVIIDREIENVLRLNCIQPITNGNMFESMGIARSRGTILYGMPGTGKTRTIMAICRELMGKCTIILAYGSDLSSPQHISQIYKTAESLSPTLLIMEDIDLAIPTRGSGYADPLSEMLQCLQGLNDKKCVVTVATTNNLESIDQALKDRPGRFDKVLEFKPPNEKQCRDMIDLFLKDNKQATCNFDMDKLAKECVEAGLTGAQLREIIDFAVITEFAKSKNKKKKVIIDQDTMNQSMEYFQKHVATMGFKRKG